MTKYFLPFLAALGFSYAVYSVVQAAQVPPPSQPRVTPPLRPKMETIAGAGLVEAQRENIPIGSPTAGVVWEVFVKIGDSVKVGDALFRLDDREFKADLKVRQAMVSASKSQLQRLVAAPRPEDVPPAKAAVAEATARLNDAEAALRRTEKLHDRNMVPTSDFDRDRYSAVAAAATLERSKADLQKILAGTWKEDIEVAKAAVAQAESELERVQVALDRLTVRALTEGVILQVNIRPGQFAAATWKEPMIVIGDLSRLHVRVDVDENDLSMFRPNTKAVATLKGRPEVKFELDFVKVEPFVVPKKSLTGDNSERVDTRVLQVVYAIRNPSATPLYVGQQMDVFIEAGPPASVVAAVNE